MANKFAKQTGLAVSAAATTAGTQKISGISLSKLEEHKEAMQKHKAEMADQLQEIKDAIVAADERYAMTTTELE